MSYRDLPSKQRVGAGTLAGQPAEQAAAAVLQAEGINVEEWGLRDTSTSRGTAAKMGLLAGKLPDLVADCGIGFGHFDRAVLVECKGGRSGQGGIVLKLADLLKATVIAEFFELPLVFALYDSDTRTVHFVTPAAIGWAMRQRGVQLEVLDLDVPRVPPKPAVVIPFEVFASVRVAHTVRAAAQDAYNATRDQAYEDRAA